MISFDTTKGAMSSMAFMSMEDFTLSRLGRLMEEHYGITDPLPSVVAHAFVVDHVCHVLRREYGLTVVGDSFTTGALQQRVIDEFHAYVTRDINLNWMAKTYADFSIQVAYNGRLLILIPCLIRNTTA